MAGIRKGVDFPVSADDQFSATFAKLKSQVKDAQSYFDGLRGVLEKTFAGISIAGLAEMVKGSIEAMSRLDDLSKTTGLAVTTLSGLGLAAKQSGGDLEGIASSIDKLGVNIGKQGDRFKQLGITARDPLQAFEQLSDIFVSIQDPQMRAALGAEALGKSWQSAAPLLAQGGAKIQEMVERGEALSGITDDMAGRANELGGKWAEVTTAGEGLLAEFVVPAIPLLEKMAETLTSLRGANLPFDALAESLRAVVVLGGNVAFVFEGIGRDLGAMAVQVQALGQAWIGLQTGRWDLMTDGLSRFNAFGELARKDAEDARAAFDKWEASVMSLDTTLRAGQAPLSAVNAQVAALSEGLYAGTVDVTQYAYGMAQLGLQWAAAPARVAAFLASQHQQRDAFKEVDAALRGQFAWLEGSSAKWDKDLETITEGFTAGTVSLGQLTVAMMAFGATSPVVEKTFKAMDAATQQWLEHELDIIALNKQANVVLQDAHRAAAEQADDLQFEIGLLGKTQEETAKLTALRQADADLMRQAASMSNEDQDSLTPASAAYLSNLALINAQHKIQIGSLYDEKTAIGSQLSVWGELGDKAGEFFGDIVLHGRGAFDDLRGLVRQFFADMVSLFAKRWLLQLAATGTALAGGSGTALANQAGSVGAGTLESAAGSWLTGGLVGAGDFAGGLVGLGSASVSSGLATMGIAAQAGTAAVGGFAEVVSAAIPVIGWIAAIGIALYAIFGSKGGSPKAGGSFIGGFDASGAFGGAQAGRYFTPDQADAGLQQSVITGSQAYYAAVARYHGTAQALNFGLGYDTDPGGTADNRVSGSVTNASGDTYFSQLDRGIGRDQDQIAPELQLTLSREILAGLQHTALPAAISAIFKTVDAASATQDQINSIFQLADAFQTLTDSLGPLNIGDIIKQATESSVDALGDQGRALQKLASSSQLTTTDLQNLTQATGDFKNAAAQLIVQIEQVKTSLHDMFSDTSRSITLSGMTSDQQYQFYQTEVQSLLQQALSSSDPALVQSLGQKIDQDIEAAWGLLGQDQQNALRPQFLTNIGSADSAIGQHLTDLQGTVSTMANSITAAIKDALGDFATKFGDSVNKSVDAAGAQQQAAATQQKAADTNLAAASVTRQIIIVDAYGREIGAG